MGDFIEISKFKGLPGINILEMECISKIFYNFVETTLSLQI